MGSSARRSYWYHHSALLTMEDSPVYLLWPYLVHGLELPASCLAHLGQAEPGIVLGHVHLEGEGEGEGEGFG